MRQLIGYVLFLGIFLNERSALATSVRPLSLEEATIAAAAVLVVEPLASTTRIGPANMPWADYDVAVVDVLKGSHHAGERMLLSFARGIAGVPTLELRRRYVIFYDDAPARPMPTVGWTRGLFAVDRDGTTLRPMLSGEAQSRTAPLRLSDPIPANGDGTLTTFGHAPLDRNEAPLTLEGLRSFVRASNAGPERTLQ